jgi:hypothetical protein
MALGLTDLEHTVDDWAVLMQQARMSLTLALAAATLHPRGTTGTGAGPGTVELAAELPSTHGVLADAHGGGAGAVPEAGVDVTHIPGFQLTGRALTRVASSHGHSRMGSRLLGNRSPSPVVVSVNPRVGAAQTEAHPPGLMRSGSVSPVGKPPRHAGGIGPVLLRPTPVAGGAYETDDIALKSVSTDGPQALAHLQHAPHRHRQLRSRPASVAALQSELETSGDALAALPGVPLASGHSSLSALATANQRAVTTSAVAAVPLPPARRASTGDTAALRISSPDRARHASRSTSPSPPEEHAASFNAMPFKAVDRDGSALHRGVMPPPAASALVGSLSLVPSSTVAVGALASHRAEGTTHDVMDATDGGQEEARPGTPHASAAMAQFLDTVRGNLAMMALSVLSVQRMLDGFLTVDKLDGGAFQLELAPFHAGAFAETAYLRVAPNANHGGITLTTHVAPDVPPLVLGDFHRLMQVRAVASLGIGGGRGRLWPVTRAPMCRSTSALCACLVWRHDAAWRRVGCACIPRRVTVAALASWAALCWGRRGRIACPAQRPLPTTATWLRFMPLGARV